MDTEPALLPGRGDSAPGPAPRARARLALRLAGSGLLIAAGAIHLALYLTGYRSIPTIGWLFLFQVIAAFVLGGSVPAAGGPATTAPGALKTVRIGAVTVLADANGRTLYWFAPDTAARSACYGSCAAYWPPVKGPATAGPGVMQVRDDLDIIG